MQAPLTALARNFAPQLLQLGRAAAAPATAALSLRAWHAGRCASTSPGSPDPFTQQLQQKTEQEILELLEKGRAAAGTSEEQGPADDIQPGQDDEGSSGEIGGPKGPEPTRFGDWEIKGRVSDF